MEAIRKCQCLTVDEGDEGHNSHQSSSTFVCDG